MVCVVKNMSAPASNFRRSSRPIQLNIEKSSGSLGFLSSKKFTYALIVLVFVLIVYHCHYWYKTCNQDNTDSNNKKLVTQAAKWKSASTQFRVPMKAQNSANKFRSSFVNDNKQSNVVHFNDQNPFVGKIKNGYMIDGGFTS